MGSVLVTDGGQGTGGEAVSANSHQSRRLKVLLCPDVIGWAYDNITNNVIRHQSGGAYEFSRAYIGDYQLDLPRFVFENFIQQQFDVVHVFFREAMGQILSPETLSATARYYKLAPETVAAAVMCPVLTTSIYDHLHVGPGAIAERRRFFHLIDGYLVSSNRLEAIYETIEGIPPPKAVVPDGVDLDLFRPQNLDRFDQLDRVVRIGWVGNSQWGTDHAEDPKGLHTILKPAIARLKSEGYPVEEHLADVNIRRRTRDEMVHYYGEIDILVCASLIEGTPNPALEASACGVPMVSTDVGIVPELFGPEQSKFILAKRSPEHMYEALKRLVTQPVLMKQLSMENIESAKTWQWADLTKGWNGFFDRARAAASDRQYRFLRQELLAAEIRAGLLRKSGVKAIIKHTLARSKTVQHIHATQPGLVRVVKRVTGI